MPVTASPRQLLFPGQRSSTAAPSSTWADAHTLHAARRGADRPDGAVIATIRPHTWKEHPVRVLDVSP